MREMLAQRLLFVGGEIDDQQPPAGTQQPRGFGERAAGIVEEMQHLMDDDEIIGAALHRRGVDVALAQLHVAQAAARSMRARATLSIAGLRSTPTARLGERGEQFEHAAGSRAEVEQRLDRRIADEIEDRGFDLRLGRVHGADAIPFGGLRGEISGRLLAPGLARHLEPRPIGGERRIVGGDAGDQVARERAARFRQPEERPGALAMPLGEARIDQQLQVARDARLRLAENADQLADRQLRFAEQAEQAQPRDFAGRFEGAEQRFEREGGGVEMRHKDMFMSIS